MKANNSSARYSTKFRKQIHSICDYYGGDIILEYNGELLVVDRIKKLEYKDDNEVNQDKSILSLRKAADEDLKDFKKSDLDNITGGD